MRAWRHLLASTAVSAAMALAPGCPRAQTSDDPYVPTPQVVVDEMLRIAGVGPKDYLIDLGALARACGPSLHRAR